MKISKKALALVLSLVLVAGCVVGGAVAWLTKTTGPVTNTFTAANLVDPDVNSAFVLKEHKANRDTNNGKYTLDDKSVVEKNDYIVVPGVDLPKDPFISVKTAENTYLFVEVVNELPAGMTATVDATVWSKMDGVVGPHNGEVYTLKSGMMMKGDYTGANTINILENKTITVTEKFAPEKLDAGKTLNFYGYLTQATGFENAQAAWDAANFAGNVQ